MLNRFLHILLLICTVYLGRSQRNLSFTHISTESGLGLFNNVITSLYQDEKGFIWVGTANGLQRFDGNKFIDMAMNKPGSDTMPHTQLSQIMPRKDGKLILSFDEYHEIGLFNPFDFSYHRIAVDLSSSIWPRGEFKMLKDGKGNIFLNVVGAAILRYVDTTNSFINDHFFKLPEGYLPGKFGFYYDAVKRQFWFATYNGLSIYDEKSREVWYRDYNPQHIPLLSSVSKEDWPAEIYIDRQRRIWLFNWLNHGKGGQVFHCFDSTGTRELPADTTGIVSGRMGYSDYRCIQETKTGEFWIYGTNALYNFDRSSNRFHYNINNGSDANRGVSCGHVYEMMEDRDGNVWIATDGGLYYTNYNSSSAYSSIINFGLDESKSQLEISDIIEMPDGNILVGLWGEGVAMVDSNFKESRPPVYTKPPPQSWPDGARFAVKSVWNMCLQKATGKVLITCNYGVLLQYDPATRSTAYYFPPECNHSTIRQVVEDQQGVVWMGTQGGRLVKWVNDTFTVVHEFGSFIPKVFVDKQGWIWVSTSNKGVYAVDPVSDKILQRYTRDADPNSMYMNGGTDIEQLNDSIIVVAAGALNFINKHTLKIRLFRFEDGLPSNSVSRMRMDNKGYLWFITNNGLCRYNPANNRINTYGQKDGIVVARITDAADYMSSKGYMIFAGRNKLLLFKPSVFNVKLIPDDVVITDFKLHNQYLPVDSLMQQPELRLNPEQNSFDIYFSSLSYAQKDRLTYYYKMEGIDKNWSVADQTYFKNYSLLPPGHYVFKVYSESIDGQRSSHITEMHIYIKPPFWATKWFITLTVLAVAFIIYNIHINRVNKIMAMEKLRNRVARDLHDDMGSTLSTINILSAMAKTKMATDPVRTSEYLTKISDNSQRMMEAMDDIVWSIKPSNDSLQKITARMREFATNVLEAKDIALTFEVEENICDLKLNMAARRDFFLVFKESVNNAAKYSKADRISISVSCKNKRLILLVKDNGIGFITRNADSGNGLSNMVKRTESMNGKISIKSAPGQGTEVVMSIPVS